MHLTRRDFAKTGPGGLLGSVLALWPGKVVGKVKPKFPMYLVEVRGRQPPTVCLADSATDFRMQRSDYGPYPLYVITSDPCMLRPGTFADVERRAAEGKWKEITAAEAEALLKPQQKTEPFPVGGPQIVVGPRMYDWLLEQGFARKGQGVGYLPSSAMEDFS